jgi:ERCC4-type nuclease
MTFVTILRDNREKKPYKFAPYDTVATRDVTLSTGDYTLAKFCTYDDETNTYHPSYSVERKAGQDFVKSITYHRERFKNEVKRAGDWPEPLRVVIEEPWETYRDEQDFMQYRDVHPRQIKGTIDAWENHYNVLFSFHSGRGAAEQETLDMLFGWYRE